ncbi:Na+/H+ antiporter NhaC family protein [Anaerovorax odorimutans]|uniref:Na+/H+ antiporter NhaC family protein n=1 Tax=Anaerovorax odorimutans TaxID=109327 RepID=UPI000414E7CD|nr:Na+/H+ antiporter NhaC family protein [Anaerovorax odorimutans]
MDYGIISCIPIAVLIIGVLITKKMPEMIILSSVIGAVLVYKSDFFSGYVGMLYGALSNESYQFLLMLLLGFGGIIKLFEKSGALLGFSNIISKYANGPKKSMVATWIMGVIMFVDDYLNVLAVSFSMKEITDRNGVPREHLAYGVNSMGACVCVLVPFTSWAAFAVGCISEQGLGFNDYVKAIPYMFFPIIAILVCLLVAIGVIPKVGLIKRAYKRVAEGGPVIVEEAQGQASIVKMESPEASEEVKASSPLNFIIPIIVLVVVMLTFNNDVVKGIIAALVVQAILYVSQRIMKLSEFIENFFEGLAGMAPLAFIICFAYILGAANDALGFSTFVINALTSTIPPSLLPAIAFLVVALVAFAAASFWVLIVITVPIFIPLAINMGIEPAMVIAAIMSGVAFGSKFCFYSDAVFMTSAGTGVSNMTQIKAVAPYVLSSAFLAAICFAIVGFVFI